MIDLDTNVLARYFVAENDADAATERQRRAARDLIESGQPLFLAKTVALELEWVLQVFDHLLAHPGLTAEDRRALHHASCRSCASMASFDDRGFGRRIRELNLAPRLFVPAAA